MYACLLKVELNSQPTVVFMCPTWENRDVVQRVNGDLHDPGP